MSSPACEHGWRIMASRRCGCVFVWRASVAQSSSCVRTVITGNAIAARPAATGLDCVSDARPIAGTSRVRKAVSIIVTGSGITANAAHSGA